MATKNIIKSFRLTQAEADEAAKKAKELNMTFAEYVRYILMTKLVFVRRIPFTQEDKIVLNDFSQNVIPSAIKCQDLLWGIPEDMHMKVLQTPRVLTEYAYVMEKIADCIHRHKNYFETLDSRIS